MAKYWVLDSRYSGELDKVADRITSYVKGKYPNIERTYKKTFTVTETESIIRHYVNYCLTKLTYWKGHQETGYLKDPFFRYIVKTMTGTTTYSFKNKGLRDRVWVIIAALKSLSSNIMIRRWYRPAEFQKTYTPLEREEITRPERQEITRPDEIREAQKLRPLEEKKKIIVIEEQKIEQKKLIRNIAIGVGIVGLTAFVTKKAGMW